jgi:hypothetical protein
MQNCQTCGKAILGDEVLYTADAKVVCPGCFDTADVAATTMRGTRPFTVYAAGAIVGMLPFMFHVTDSSTVMVNGEVVSATSRDYFALVCGAVAALLGALGVVGATRSKSGGPALAGWIAIVAIGAYQIARGLGAI